jgi:hypothetical protein
MHVCVFWYGLLITSVRTFCILRIMLIQQLHKVQLHVFYFITVLNSEDLE